MIDWSVLIPIYLGATVLGYLTGRYLGAKVSRTLGVVAALLLAVAGVILVGVMNAEHGAGGAFFGLVIVVIGLIYLGPPLILWLVSGALGARRLRVLTERHAKLMQP